MGLFPPPIDGQRVITQRMFEQMDGATTVARHDLDRYPRLGALSKPLSALMAVLLVVVSRLRGFSTVYLAPHSGTGLIYSCLIVLASRCFGYELYVHYHSFRNIARYSRLMAAFVSCCGLEAVHIVLGPPMEQGLRQLYKSVQRVAIVSNSVFVPPRRVSRVFDGRRIRLGHLSNLSREKGIAVVLECLRRLAAHGLEVELLLAGPATDGSTAELVNGAVAEFGDRLRYLGPLSRPEVHRFYEEIDVFLFPTLHEHEAEPLVIIDAVSAGVPVIATDRGCIRYFLGTTGGRALTPPDFVEHAVEQISTWVRHPEQLAAASAGAQARFHELHDASQAHLDGLLLQMLTRAQR